MLGTTFIKELKLFDPLHRLLTQPLNNEMLDYVCLCAFARLDYITSGYNLPSVMCSVSGLYN